MPFKGVRVAIPYGVSFEEAEKEVYSRVKWIKKHLSRMKKVEEEYSRGIDLGDMIDPDLADKMIVARVEELSGKFGLVYNKLTIRTQKTRWGSCSSKGNINLNIHLMRLPDNLIDLVILHELAHTVELNHSRKFWNILDKIFGNAKLLDRELKNYKTRIY